MHTKAIKTEDVIIVIILKVVVRILIAVTRLRCMYLIFLLPLHSFQNMCGVIRSRRIRPRPNGRRHSHLRARAAASKDLSGKKLYKCVAWLCLQLRTLYEPQKIPFLVAKKTHTHAIPGQSSARQRSSSAGCAIVRQAGRQASRQAIFYPWMRYQQNVQMWTEPMLKGVNERGLPSRPNPLIFCRAADPPDL